MCLVGYEMGWLLQKQTIEGDKSDNSKLTSLVVGSVRLDSWCTSHGVTGSWPVSGYVMMKSKLGNLSLVM